METLFTGALTVYALLIIFTALAAATTAIANAWLLWLIWKELRNRPSGGQTRMSTPGTTSHPDPEYSRMYGTLKKPSDESKYMPKG